MCALPVLVETTVLVVSFTVEIVWCRGHRTYFHLGQRPPRNGAAAVDRSFAASPSRVRGGGDNDAALQEGIAASLAQQGPTKKARAD